MGLMSLRDRAAQQFADDTGLSKWDASVKLRDDHGDPYVIGYSALHVLAENVGYVSR